MRHKGEYGVRDSFALLAYCNDPVAHQRVKSASRIASLEVTSLGKERYAE